MRGGCCGEASYLTAAAEDEASAATPTAVTRFPQQTTPTRMYASGDEVYIDLLCES